MAAPTRKRNDESNVYSDTIIMIDIPKYAVAFFLGDDIVSFWLHYH
jgi:hypothetical protein